MTVTAHATVRSKFVCCRRPSDRVVHLHLHHLLNDCGVHLHLSPSPSPSSCGLGGHDFANISGFSNALSLGFVFDVAVNKRPRKYGWKGYGNRLYLYLNEFLLRESHAPTKRVLKGFTSFKEILVLSCCIP